MAKESANEHPKSRPHPADGPCSHFRDDPKTCSPRGGQRIQRSRQKRKGPFPRFSRQELSRSGDELEDMGNLNADYGIRADLPGTGAGVYPMPKRAVKLGLRVHL